MKRNMAMWAAVLACISLLVLASQVSAISLTASMTDPYALGKINDGSPSSGADEQNYISHLIGMTVGSTESMDSINGNAAFGQNYYIRSGNAFSPLDTPVFASRPSFSANNGLVTIGLGTSGYMYLLGKYDGQNFGDMVWYVGGLTGDITIPSGAGTGNWGLSHFSLFNPGTPPNEVPDGGATLLLLGAALSGLGLLRRKLG